MLILVTAGAVLSVVWACGATAVRIARDLAHAARDRRIRAQLPPSAPAFASARGWHDLGALMVLWLDGALFDTPVHGGPPADETAGIASHLRALNRSGLVTIGSQPGLVERGWFQRAYVQMVGPYPRLANAAAALTATPGIRAWVRPLADLDLDPHSRETVTVTRHGPFTCSGTGDLLVWGHVCMLFEGMPAATQQRLLAEGAVLVAVDMRWGRAGHLWDALAAASHRDAA